MHEFVVIENRYQKTAQLTTVHNETRDYLLCTVYMYCTANIDGHCYTAYALIINSGYFGWVIADGDYTGVCVRQLTIMISSRWPIVTPQRKKNRTGNYDTKTPPFFSLSHRGEETACALLPPS